MEYDQVLNKIPGPPLVLVEVLDGMAAALTLGTMMSEFEIEFSEVVDEMLTYIVENETADGCLEAFVDAFEENHQQHGASDADTEIAGRVVKTLGTAMINQFRNLGLYSYNDTFPYRFIGWSGPHCMIFEKYLETDAFSN